MKKSAFKIPQKIRRANPQIGMQIVYTPAILGKRAISSGVGYSTRTIPSSGDSFNIKFKAAPKMITFLGQTVKNETLLINNNDFINVLPQNKQADIALNLTYPIFNYSYCNVFNNTLYTTVAVRCSNNKTLQIKRLDRRKMTFDVAVEGYKVIISFLLLSLLFYCSLLFTFDVA